MAGYSDQNAFLFQNECSLFFLLDNALNNDRFIEASFEVPLEELNGLGIESKKEIDLFMKLDNEPNIYCEVKTGKSGIVGLRSALHNLNLIYKKDKKGRFKICVSADMSTRSNELVTKIKNIRGKSRIYRDTKQYIVEKLKISEEEFKNTKPFLEKVEFYNEGNFKTQKDTSVGDGTLLQNELKRLICISCKEGNFGSWTDIGFSQEDVIDILIKKIAEISGARTISGRTIDRKEFIEKVIDLLAKNRTIDSPDIKRVGQKRVHIIKQQLMEYYFPREKTAGDLDPTSKGVV